MENQIFCIGQEVVRLGSLKDYASNRLGTVIEINEETRRARVHWTHDRYNSPLNVKTWVRFKDLTPKIIL